MDGEMWMKVYWNLFYWVSFCSSLVAMPLVIYYYQSSELEYVYKLGYALRTLVVWTLLPVALGVLVWGYLFVKGLITIWSTPQLIIAVSNA